MLLGWMGSFARRAIEHGHAIRRVEALGGTVWYFAPMRDSLVPPPGPSVLRSVFDDKAFAQVSSVDLGSCRSLVDADLQLFRSLPEVSVVNLCGSRITDKGIENLSGLGNLRVVNLLDTRATTGGLGGPSVGYVVAGPGPVRQDCHGLYVGRRGQIHKPCDLARDQRGSDRPRVGSPRQPPIPKGSEPPRLSSDKRRRLS